MELIRNRLLRLNARIAGSRADQVAAAWVIRVERGQLSDAELDEFGAWLESQENRAAYELASRIWVQPAPLTAGELSRLENELENRPTWRVAIKRPALATAAIAGLALIGITVISMRVGDGVHETGPGEQRVLRLADNSRVFLNIQSKMRVSYTDGVRFVQLPTGEAFFEVAPNKARPFVVQTDDATIRAVGTKFDVKVNEHGTVVSVIEGAVEVKESRLSSDGQVEKETISVGQRLAYHRDAARTVIDREDVEKQTAWRQGRIEFDHMPLRDAVEEINRYRKKPVVIGDPEIADIPVSGSFKISATDGFLKALSGLSAVEVIERTDDFLVLKVN